MSIAIANSTFLEFSSAGMTTEATVAAAYGFDPSQISAAASNIGVNVALVLTRANDPTALLASSWGERQAQLSSLEDAGALWSTYGTDAAVYSSVLQTLSTLGISTIGDANGADGYVTSAESRTIWISLSAADFASFFGTTLMVAGDPAHPDLVFWDGTLEVPDAIAPVLAGLWPDIGAGAATSNLASTEDPLAPGPQSPGNLATLQTQLFPSDIAALYDFPLTGLDVETGTVALVETGVGSALPPGTTESFQDLLDAYRLSAGLTTAGSYYTVANNGQTYGADAAGERSLDVGVLSSAAPNSALGLYAGSGNADYAPGNYAQGTVYTSYQGAIWDIANNPGVLSSSWSDGAMPGVGSPFLAAYRELFVDAALRNMSVFNDAFDGGSGNETSTGLTSLFTGSMSPYAVVVGGTSLSTAGSAQTDTTLASLLAAAEANDLGTLWTLIAGGLTQWPEDATLRTTVVETVWNQYFVDGADNLHIENGYLENFTTSGGVDTTQATPDYQTAFGLTPTSANPASANPGGASTGRGAPDVSAIAGGNMYYIVPEADMSGLDTYGGGTSAATPLWAALTAQFNAIFEDQGLPQLGYMNDLLYLAAAVSPAAFNDITMGNNTSSFIYGGKYRTDGYDITPTGYGYEAGEGYDLTTGLGSPNGLLLARALTTIAHSQMYFDTPAVLDQSGSDWTSGAGQSLLFQSSLASDADWSLTLGTSAVSFSGIASDSYAWTARLAQQSLQADFSSDLVTMFDGQSQGQVYQATVADGADVGIAIGGSAASAYQASLTADYGYVDFVTGDGAVNVARPVAVATTAGGADDQDVVVRMRQNGMNEVAVLFYEVDDFSGTINGLTPDDAGY
ncbi:MAG: hypothetical protein B7Z15_13000, partial [Rhizobiales bacterium 32-66-8]